MRARTHEPDRARVRADLTGPEQLGVARKLARQQGGEPLVVHRLAVTPRQLSETEPVARAHKIVDEGAVVARPPERLDHLADRSLVGRFGIGQGAVEIEHDASHGCHMPRL